MGQAVLAHLGREVGCDLQQAVGQDISVHGVPLQAWKRLKIGDLTVLSCLHSLQH